MLNDDLFIRRVCGCLLSTLGNTEAAADYDEDNTDNSKDHEDYQSSMAKLYQQENIIFIAWSRNMGLNISHSEAKLGYPYKQLRMILKLTGIYGYISV